MTSIVVEVSDLDSACKQKKYTILNIAINDLLENFEDLQVLCSWVIFYLNYNHYEYFIYLV